eukprot:1159448-Pelagomonas_calceolata.AAC.5
MGRDSPELDHVTIIGQKKAQLNVKCKQVLNVPKCQNARKFEFPGVSKLANDQTPQQREYGRLMLTLRTAGLGRGGRRKKD